MTLSKGLGAALRALAALPEDDWQPEDWAVFSACQVTVREALAKQDRAVRRKAEAEVQRQEVRPLLKPDRGTWVDQTDGYDIAKGRSGGRCEAGAPGCQWQASHVHHIAGRRIPDPHHPDNLLHVCEACHTHIHGHPEESRRNGWMRSRLATNNEETNE